MPAIASRYSDVRINNRRSTASPIVDGGPSMSNLNVDQFLYNLRFPDVCQSVTAACQGFVTKLSTRSGDNMSGLCRILSNMKNLSPDILDLISTDNFVIAIPTYDALNMLVNNDRFIFWLSQNLAIQIVIVDVVKLFLAQRKSDAAELQAVNNFLATFADRIVFQKTEYGMLIETAVDDSDFVFPPETWDLSIISYCKFVTGNPSEKPVLGLIEDGWFEMHTGIDIDALRLIPVSRFLADMVGDC